MRVQFGLSRRRFARRSATRRPAASRHVGGPIIQRTRFLAAIGLVSAICLALPSTGPADPPCGTCPVGGAGQVCAWEITWNYGCTFAGFPACKCLNDACSPAGVWSIKVQQGPYAVSHEELPSSACLEDPPTCGWCLVYEQRDCTRNYVCRSPDMALPCTTGTTGNPCRWEMTTGASYVTGWWWTDQTCCDAPV
jgi:hypothetical protein